MKNFFQRFYMGLILFFLYVPIVTLVVLSFNASKSRAKWGGFTGKWYVALFQNSEIMNALYRTLIIALLSAAIATVIGTLASIAMQAMGRKMRTLMTGVTNIPMLNADIVTGISLMLLFLAGRFTLGFATVLIAHITFNIPYVILSVLPRLKQMDRRTFEAALDLGASPLQAFFKVVVPEISPGILSGFLLAFTMSIDDFIITHFTKGPGVDTLSTKIYSEVRLGIKPEMYALSTILFALVLILLFMVNRSPATVAYMPTKGNEDEKSAATHKSRGMATRFLWNRVVPAILVLAIIGGGFYYGQKGSFAGSEQVIVYNYGEYLDPEAIEMFEEETGINVVYEEYETNEIMYPKIASGAVAYDLVCPSEYMVQRMIGEGLLQPINWDNVPNAQEIDPIYMEQARSYDPDNTYSMPYLWGTVGILYNTTMVDEPIDSWSVLWDEKYKDQILMQDSVRDSLGVALKYLGHSLNATDLDELTAAKDLLKEQKPLVQAYVVDQAKDKMIGNEAAIAVIYSGDAYIAIDENPDLEYVIPKEGSNVWIDGWVIPANARNVENAEKFLDFLCRPEIAMMNFDYIAYSVPITEAIEEIEAEDEGAGAALFPDEDDLRRCETFTYLGDEWNDIYNSMWKEVKSQ